jgi:hypothetical protein
MTMNITACNENLLDTDLNQKFLKDLMLPCQEKEFMAL